MKEKLQIAVRALVEHALRAGDLNLTFTGASRTVQAIRAHQKVQRSRPAHYEPEVSISREVDTDTFILVVSGRIDGVYTAAAGNSVIIDEIKTTTGELERVADSNNLVHWGQLKTYAYLYAAAHDISRIEVQLTYYQLDTGKTLEIRRSFDRETLTTFFEDLVGRYLAWATVWVDWCHTRDESIEKLSFPFRNFRAGQRDMAVQVYKTIQHQQQLLVQAPTGIGKTMAALFPAVKARGRKWVEKIFYLTARTTARSVAEKAMGLLLDHGLKMKTLTLTAKDKICFNPEAICTGDECPYARGHFDRINAAVADLFVNRDDMTRRRVEATAHTHRVCPFELSLELTHCADVIIGDYNYAFDPRVYLRHFFSAETGSYTFLVDEAHNLVDRSRGMFSAEIHKQPVLDLRRVIKVVPQIFKTLGRINTHLLTIRKTCDAAGEPVVAKEAPLELAAELKAFHTQAERWLAKNKPAEFREQLLAFYFEVGAFLRILEAYDDSTVTCMEKIGKDVRVKLFCIDPTTRMREALTRCRSAVFFSATLTPQHYFRKLFGCRDSAYGLTLPSPFPPDRLCLMLANRISTRYRRREMSLASLVRLITALVRCTTGNTLLFFPSYQYMTMASQAFAEACPDINTIIQQPGMSEAERDAFLEEFSHENRHSLVGFAVMGGIFGEGIDLTGDRLTGAVIVGVGLPGISTENELIRDYFNRADGTGFEYAYLYPGINRVLQAAGRVIRSESDRGVVLLMDDRYTTAPYAALLPAHWHPVCVRNEDDIDTQLGNFWKEPRA